MPVVSPTSPPAPVAAHARLASAWRLAVVAVLGFASGLPLALTGQAMQAWLSLQGIDLATIRDVAAAARMSTGTVYRAIESKENLMASILWSYTEKTTEGWNAVKAASTRLDSVILPG